MNARRNRMGIALLWPTISVILIGSSMAAAGEVELQERTKRISALICASPEVPKDIFAADFLASVPAEKLALTCKGIFEKTGAVTGVKITAAAEWKREMLFATANGMEMPVTIHLESAAPHRIDGLWFGMPRPAVKSLAEIQEKLKELSGTTSMSLWRLKDEGGHVALMAHNQDADLAIGSTFKLYILGAIIEEISAEKLTWKHVARVRPHRRSWPSGILHEWPDGSPLTLHSLASLMISRSDNTATDILLFTLGRRRVEAMMSLMGNEHLERTIPFLGTREMFILRSVANTKLKEKYLALDKTARRRFLREEIGAIKRDGVEISLEGKEFHELEWFASTADLCRAMMWLKAHTEAEGTRAGRELMTINEGMSFTEGKWKTVAFKGGSEPGVTNLTWLLQRADGAWFALSATNNNPDGPVDSGFGAAVQGLISFLERDSDE